MFSIIQSMNTQKKLGKTPMIKKLMSFIILVSCSLALINSKGNIFKSFACTLKTGTNTLSYFHFEEKTSISAGIQYFLI